MPLPDICTFLLHVYCTGRCYSRDTDSVLVLSISQPYSTLVALVPRPSDTAAGFVEKNSPLQNLV